MYIYIYIYLYTYITNLFNHCCEKQQWCLQQSFLSEDDPQVRYDFED